jgi:hypothetical protein
MPAVRSGKSVERNDLMILASGVRIPLWDVGPGLSDETIKPRSRVAVGVAR